MASNPCWCIKVTPQPTTPSNPSCNEDANECCLEACSGTIYCDNAVGPCGKVGNFDLTTLPHNLTGCLSGIQYSLEKYDSFFVNASVSTAGVLSWTTGGPETANQYGKIYFKISCQSDCGDCITLKAVGRMTIGVKDECQNTICDPTCEVCDPCEGTCIDLETNISIE